jgi:hypothetical protein
MVVGNGECIRRQKYFHGVIRPSSISWVRMLPLLETLCWDCNITSKSLSCEIYAIICDHFFVGTTLVELAYCNTMRHTYPCRSDRSRSVPAHNEQNAPRSRSVLIPYSHGYNICWSSNCTNKYNAFSCTIPFIDRKCR